MAGFLAKLDYIVNIIQFDNSESIKILAKIYSHQYY